MFVRVADQWQGPLVDGLLTYGQSIEDSLSSDEVERANTQIQASGAIFNSVDEVPEAHSNARYQSRPRHQDGRGTCACFAVAAAMEGLYRRMGHAVDLSEQYINWVAMRRSTPSRNWCGDGIRVVDAVRFLTEEGTCSALLCPYESQRQVALHCNDGPSLAAQAAAVHRIADFCVLPRAVSPGGDGFVGTLRRVIGAGHDVLLSVIPAFGNERAGGVHDVHCRPDGTVYYPPEGQRPTHALLATGYGTAASGIRYIECKDSRGPTNKGRHEGYLWLSDAFVDAYVRYGVVLLAVSR